MRNSAFGKLWPTSELNFAESLPELGAGEYDFMLHLKFLVSFHSVVWELKLNDLIFAEKFWQIVC